MHQLASYLLLACFYIASVIVQVFPAKLPGNFKPCDLTGEGSNECIREALQYALNNYPKGSDQVGVLPLDPLEVAEMVIFIENNKIAEGNYVMSNFTMSGLSKSKITEFERVKSDGLSFQYVSEIPIYSLVGPYKVDATVLQSSFYGKGISNITLHNLKTMHHVSGELFKRKNEQYFNITSYTAELQSPRMDVYLGNLFDGDIVLGNRINFLLQENQGIIFEAIKPYMAESFSLIYKGTLDNFLRRIPVKKLAILD